MADDSPALFYQRQYWFQMIQHMADSMGVELSRIEAASYSVAAPEDLVSPTFTIKKGRTGSVAYESIGYVGDKPFITMRVGWYHTPLLKPAHVNGTTEWIITIEGRPATRCVLNVAPSFLSEVKTIEGDPARQVILRLQCAYCWGFLRLLHTPQVLSRRTYPRFTGAVICRMITPSNQQLHD
jgi:hypothetical protein